MATTTNYGWTTPDDTALVKDGASAIRTLGTSIDTTVKALSPGTTSGDLDYYTSATAKARLAKGTAGQVLTMNSGATAPEWATSSSGGMTLISTTTLTGATVSLTSIPATYNDLRIVIKNFIPATDNKYMLMRFNSDATASRHSDQSGSDGASAQTFSRTDVGLGQRNDNGVGNGLITIEVLDYKNTSTWKMSRAETLTTDPTTTANFGYQRLLGFYNQTSAISSIDFLIESGGNFTSGTVLLYGVK